MGKRDDNFDSASYVRVNERLSAFREEYKEGAIITERGCDESGVFYKCLIFRNLKEIELYATAKVASATGHSYLDDQDRDNDKVEEYSETVAIGRALACLGYGVEKSIASAEEMERYNQLHGEESVEEVEEETDSRSRRTRRQAASKEEPKLRTSRKYKRSSKLKK